MIVLRPLIVAAGLIAAWQAFVWITALPAFIVPPPARVFAALVGRADFLLAHAWVTLAEMLMGLALGAGLGLACALAMARFAGVRRWILPLVIASQAIPVFAIAPLLVIWFDYGMASKVIAATLIIFFPVASTLADGLLRTERGQLDLAQVMGATPMRLLFLLRLPAAMPAFASGMRMAATVAPIGAVIGEWVGASAGLGFIMLQANARMQTDMLFAALFILAVVAIALYYAVDLAMRRLVWWQPVTAPEN
jgi:putative hydroxymethylpyrimidine transport system permease protein